MPSYFSILFPLVWLVIVYYLTSKTTQYVTAKTGSRWAAYPAAAMVIVFAIFAYGFIAP